LSEGAAGGATKRCLLAWAGPGQQVVIEVEVPGGANVAQLIAAARRSHPDAALPWESTALGIFGEPCGLESVPRDGDRVEFYRALLIDPREARRTRARRRSGG
jgi:putative ubiquitin-RnfH superfamily antitoxin RatB of RatAB toxin-antitoxin module